MEYKIMQTIWLSFCRLVAILSFIRVRRLQGVICHRVAPTIFTIVFALFQLHTILVLHPLLFQVLFLNTEDLKDEWTF